MSNAFNRWLMRGPVRSWNSPRELYWAYSRQEQELLKIRYDKVYADKVNASCSDYEVSVMEDLDLMGDLLWRQENELPI